MRPARANSKTRLKRETLLNTPGVAFAFEPCGEEAGDENTDVIDLTGEEPITLVPLTALTRIEAPLLTGEVDHVSEDITENLEHIVSAADLLAWCAKVIDESPSARALCAEAAQGGWSIGLVSLPQGGFYLDLEQRLLLLDHFALTPSLLARLVYFRNLLLTTMIRALRDIWHEARAEGALMNYRPVNILMLERLRAADGDTVTLHAAWELRGAGHAAVWRHLLGSAEGDMAQLFTRYLERDPGALFDGAALACTFRQWFADDARVNDCDHQTLETLDDILAVASCRNPFGERALEPALVEAMTQLPNGLSYLAGLGRVVLADPVFAGLIDSVNQAHLTHLVYDTQITMVNNVPFRDENLARKIFPQPLSTS